VLKWAFSVDDMVEVELGAMETPKAAELRAQPVARGLPATGLNAKLATRLEEAMAIEWRAQRLLYRRATAGGGASSRLASSEQLRAAVNII
jgi:hypothetical protein